MADHDTVVWMLLGLLGAIGIWGLVYAAFEAVERWGNRRGGRDG